MVSNISHLARLKRRVLFIEVDALALILAYFVGSIYCICAEWLVK